MPSSPVKRQIAFSAKACANSNVKSEESLVEHVMRHQVTAVNAMRRRSLLSAGTALLASTLVATPLARKGWAVTVPSSDSDLVGQMQFKLIDGNTTLLDIARANDLGILELSAANPGVDAWVPGEERLIVMPTAHIVPNGVERRGVIVNLSELRLYYFPDDGSSVVTSSIGIGRDGFDTPVGKSEIVRKKANPTWYPTEATRLDKPELPSVVGPGPDNPLGAHALYLGWPTYLIHGTNKPLGVGRRISRGCIRMYPERVEALFGVVPVGTPVQVVQEPLKLGRKDGEIYLEAHPDFEQLDQLENTYRFDLKPPTDITDRIIKFAGSDVSRIDWQAVRSATLNRRGYPEQITVSPIRQTPVPPEAKELIGVDGPRSLFNRS